MCDNIPKDYIDMSKEYLTEDQNKNYIALYEESNNQIIVFNRQEFKLNGMATVKGYVIQILNMKEKKKEDINQRIKFAIEDYEEMWKEIDGSK